MVKKKVKKKSSSRRVVHKAKKISKDDNVNTLLNNTINNDENIINTRSINNTNENKVIIPEVEQSNNVTNVISNTEKIIPSIDKSVPVFKENVAQTINESKTLKICGIIIGACIILFWLIVIIASIHISTGPKLVERNVTVLYYEQVKLSFDKLLDITDTNYIENVSLLGYLSEKTINIDNVTTKTTRYTVDANHNNIMLVLAYGQKDKYDKLFTNNETSLNVYNITGNYRYRFDEYVIDVATITEVTNIAQNGKKLLREVKEQRIENVTEGEEAGISFDIERGIVNVFSVFV